MLFSGARVWAQIQRVNEAIKQIGVEFLEAKRKIENELIKLGKEEFKNCKLFAEEYKKWTTVLEKSKSMVDSLKHDNRADYTGVPLSEDYERMIQEKPYKEYSISKYL